MRSRGGDTSDDEGGVGGESQSGGRGKGERAIDRERGGGDTQRTRIRHGQIALQLHRCRIQHQCCEHEIIAQ